MREPTCPREVVGLVPAGGQARRIAPLPTSKELLPIGFRSVDDGGGLRLKVVCHYLLEKMRWADIEKAFIVLGKGKWDIPAYLGDGGMFEMHLAYLTICSSLGAPYSLDQAYPFLGNAIVALGFPDILFESDDAFVQLLSLQETCKADAVLGLFPADQPHKVDMVDVDDRGHVRQLVIKPTQSRLPFTWGCAVWTPVFTQFMHEYLSALRKPGEMSTPKGQSDRKELFVGDVFQAAIDSGLRIEGKVLSDQAYLDIGTPDDLVKAVRLMSLRSTLQN